MEFKDQSDYDYLVILANSGGELTLDESHYEDKDAPHAKNKKKIPLLITNGFATLFLVFHPYYQDSFEFTDEGEEVVAGHPAVKIGFHHIAGTRSPMALMLRGRDYPVELAGMAWVDKKSGNLLRAVADIPGGIVRWSSLRTRSGWMCGVLSASCRMITSGFLLEVFPPTTS